MNSDFVRFDEYRRKTALIFRKSTTAGSVGVLFPQVLAWGMALIAGEKM